MTQKRTDQAILIAIALKLRAKPRATKFNKEWRLLELDYSYFKISELPPEIGLLSSLQVLNLNGNLLTTLPPEIGLLTDLTELSVASNQLQALPSEIWSLTNLISLDLGIAGLRKHRHEPRTDEFDADDFGTDDVDTYYYAADDDNDDDDDDDEEDRDDDDDYYDDGPYDYVSFNLDDIADYRRNSISTLPPEVGQLKNLAMLDLSLNQLREVPRELGLLQQLQVLYLANNLIAELPAEIGQLTELEGLYLQNNRLTRIPKEISHLVKLKELYLNGNNLVQIPVRIGQLDDLENLKIDNNPSLLVPPPEIVDQSTSQILEYLRELERDSITRYEAKMLLVGEGGTGKSSLLRALRGEDGGEPLSTTHGIEIGTYKTPNPHDALNDLKLNTWDFGGQQIYHATHQFFLTHRSLYLVVWNARLGAEQGRLHYWLDTIKALAPDSPVLLVATHIDERAPDLNYHLYKEAYPQLVGSVSVSNTTGVGLAELSTEIATISSGLPLMGQPWPTKWIDVEERLLALDEHHISATEYLGNCEQSGVQARVAKGTLGEFLHDLGKIMYFRDDYILSNLIVLKPNWVTKAISRVLTDEQTSNEKGILSHSELPRIWNEDENGKPYEPHLYPVFLRLMERFDLSYQIEADTPGDHPTRSLVPQLLPHEPPVKLSPWPHNPPSSGSLIEMLYNVDFVPAGIMSWFIVRTHPYTRNIHWREGALLEYEGHQARVELNPILRELRIAVWGPQPHNFFNILRNTADLILSRFEGLRIGRNVPCICHWGQPNVERCPRYYRYEDLIRRMQVKKHNVECPESFRNVSVPTLLYGIHISTDDQIIADINRGYRDIRARLDGLIRQEDQAIENLAQLSELIGRNFTRLWNFEMQKLEAECPNTFWLATHGRVAFNPKDWVSQQYRLYLLCQHPPAPHTVGDGYQLRQSQEWWLSISPWLNHLIKFVKFGVPMGKAIGSVYDESAFDKIKEQTGLMEKITKTIPQLTKGSDTKSFGVSRPELAQDVQAVGAALRALYNFLHQADPNHIWGGLNRVITPDGNILWLCPAHREQYEAKPLIL